MNLCAKVLRAAVGVAIILGLAAGHTAAEAQSDPPDDEYFNEGEIVYPEGGGEPEGQGRNYQNYMDWNICQATCWDGALHSSAQYAIRVINSTRDPRAVAVQEMCLNGFQNMLGALDNYGYQGAFWGARNVSGDCDEVGNGIFWRGGCSGNCRSTNPFDTQCEDVPSSCDESDENDNRGYACGMSTEYYARYCSAQPRNSRPAGE